MLSAKSRLVLECPFFLDLRDLLTATRLSSTAWAHDDDLEADTRPRRTGFRGNKGGHRLPASRRKDVLQQRSAHAFLEIVSDISNPHASTFVLFCYLFPLAGEYYGTGLTTANLELISRFFEKYPEYADRSFLSVKGGSVPGKLDIDGSRENLRRSVDTILKVLRGKKKLDLFEPARRDSRYEMEHYAEVLNEMIKEGKFDYIGLSEVGAETIRRAHKVSTSLGVAAAIPGVRMLIHAN